jgi:hypothetical protein
MAKVNIAPGVTYLDRESWYADSNLGRLGRIVPRSYRDRVFIHHTVIIDDSDPSKNLWETESEVIQQMQKLQTIRPDLGYDVPYNFVIFLMNTNPPSIYVCEGRGEDRSGAHTRGFNYEAIGIALQGDFETYSIDLEPYTDLISQFLGWLKFDPNAPNYGGPYAPLSHLGTVTPDNSDRQVFAHRDVSETDCPGDSTIAVLSQFRFINPDSQYDKIDAEINGKTFSEAAIVANQQPYVKQDAIVDMLSYEPDQSIPRKKQNGVVYIRANSLVPFNVSVKFQRDRETVVLNFPSKFERIQGTGKASAAQLTDFLKKHNSGQFVDRFPNIADLYVEEAAKEGINHDIAFCQMCLETAYLAFNGVVEPSQNNFAGLGAISQNKKGASFPDVKTGVKAHIQHLKAYATTESINNPPIVDPRFDLVQPRGSAPTIDDLSGKWAKSEEYGAEIMAILRDLYQSFGISAIANDEDLQA